MIVGEAPGETEVRDLQPFIGFSGKLLTELLRDVGIRREDCRIGNVSRVRPAENKFKNLPEDLVASETQHLLEDIKKTSPRVILCLGNEPFSVLTGERDISKWRGSVLWNSTYNCKVIPTYHPAFALRTWEVVPLMRFDLKRTEKELSTPNLSRIPRQWVVVNSISQLTLFLETAKKKGTVAFDLETTRGNIQVLCLAISYDSSFAFCIPITKGLDPYWSEDEEIIIWKLLAEFFGDASIKKVAHNSSFDRGVLQHKMQIPVRGMLMDTMNAFHLVYPELPKALDVVSSIYTDQPYYKHLSRSDLWQYNCLDAMVCFEAYKVLEEEMKEWGVRDFYDSKIMPLEDILLELQLRGVKINLSLRDRVRLEEEVSLEEAMYNLEKLTGFEVNIASPKQLAVLLYNKLGLPLQHKRGSESVTTDEEALSNLFRLTHHEAVNHILSYRGHAKLISTYLDAELKGGRMHCSYNIGGTVKDDGKVEKGPATGRLSSSGSIVVGSGTNLQNIPRGNFRRLFIPDEGLVLYEVDLSQAEARVVAYEAQEPTMMRVFEEGKDIHRLNASWIYGIPENEVAKDQRQFAKTHVHAFNYGEGPFTFAKRAGVLEAEGRRIRNLYFQQFPRIPRWHDEIIKQLKNGRILVNYFGRKRTFFGRWGEELFKAAFAYIPQSTVGDLLNIALVNFRRSCPSSIQVLLQVHDSFVFQAPKDFDVLTLLTKAFDIPITAHGRTYYIPWELKAGPSWGEMKDVHKGGRRV